MAYSPWQNAQPDYRAASDVSEDIDPGLREYMLKVYNFMAAGLIVSGLTGYFAVQTGFYQQIVGTPLMWVIMLAPLAAGLFLSFRIERMGVPAALTLDLDFINLFVMLLQFTGAAAGLTKVACRS
jgi:FtsH-binding integral membrane protein